MDELNKTNSKKSFVIYENWAVLLKELPDIQTAHLIKALCTYELNDEVICDDPIALAIFTSWKAKIDEDREKWLKISAKRRKASYSRWGKNANDMQVNASDMQMDSVTVTDTVTDTVTVTDTDKDNIPHKAPRRGADDSDQMIRDSDISEKAKDALLVWISYKKEQYKFKYKSVSLKALLTEVRKKETAFGADMVCDAINASIAKGYKGIAWDLIPTNQPRTSAYMQAVHDRVDVVDNW